MGFNMKTWSNPVNIDANNINRLEKGIKNAHDTLEITNEEVANLQNKQFQLAKDLNLLSNKAPDILNTLNNINKILESTDIEYVLSNTSSFLTKTQQLLTQEELNQVYKNLNIESLIKLTDVKVNGISVVTGTSANIKLPKIDTHLDLHSLNPVSNQAVTQALQNINFNVKVPTKLSELESDDYHQTITKEERVKWNSYNAPTIVEETDPTVPSWAKEVTKPTYYYHEILDTPKVITDNKELLNGAGYTTQDTVNELINNFSVLNITPINNEINNLKNNKADSTHTHTEYALVQHEHPEYLTGDHTHKEYALVEHTHTEYAEVNHTHDYSTITNAAKEYTDTAIKNLIGAAPDTLDTLEELSNAIKANKDIVDVLGDTYVTLGTDQTISGSKTFTSHIRFPSNTYIVNNNGSAIVGYNSMLRVSLGNSADSLQLNSSRRPYVYIMTKEEQLAYLSDIPDTSKFITLESLPNLDNYVTLNTEQTVTGTKTFNEIHATTIYLD